MHSFCCETLLLPKSYYVRISFPQVLNRTLATCTSFLVSVSAFFFHSFLALPHSEYPPMVSVPIWRLLKYMERSTMIFLPGVFEVTTTAARPDGICSAILKEWRELPGMV